MRIDPPKEDLPAPAAGGLPANQLAELARSMDNLARALADLNAYLRDNPQIATMPDVIKDLNQKLRTLSSRL